MFSKLATTKEAIETSYRNSGQACSLVEKMCRMSDNFFAALYSVCVRATVAPELDWILTK